MRIGAALAERARQASTPSCSLPPGKGFGAVHDGGVLWVDALRALQEAHGRQLLAQILKSQCPLERFTK